jgi:hypothetical protein
MSHNWQCISNVSTPLARINGDVACLSTDGKNCLWDYCQDNKMVGDVPDNLNPHICTKEEYNTEDHWCAKGATDLSSKTVVSKGEDKNSSPVRPKVDIPRIGSRNARSTGDYFYYIIDLVVSIIAITIALITTVDQDYTVRLTHIMLAILFRYIYLGYMVITKGMSLFSFATDLLP